MTGTISVPPAYREQVCHDMMQIMSGQGENRQRDTEILTPEQPPESESR